MRKPRARAEALVADRFEPAGDVPAGVPPEIAPPETSPPAGFPREDSSARAAPAPASQPIAKLPKAVANPVIGNVDQLTRDLISGWAWDPARPDEPITVEVVDGDEVIVTVMADIPRPDLIPAGIGDGAHAFRIRGLGGMFLQSRHRVHVRRASDHVDVPGSPRWIINEDAGFDHDGAMFMEGVMSGAIAAATSPQDLDHPLSFLLQLVNALANARAFQEEQLRTPRAVQFDSVMSQVNFSDWMYELSAKLRREYEPLRIEPPVGTPEVSVIIPVYGKFNYTYNCIKSITEHLPDCTFEVIIQDDCSTDETLLAGLLFSGAVRVVRNPGNLGFIRSCNAAARQATGKYLFFLNNDTLVRDGWLDELVATFKALPNIGIAGSKLLFEDGSLQEAGGIIWRLGDGWNWGRNRDPKEPGFCYLRDADWVSGAALMIERELFEQLNGFDELYLPAYYEDTDLAFRVRAAGKRTVVQPASEIVHLEGVTSGTDTAGTGVKRYQVINHRKFYQRWRDTLARHRFNGERPDLEAERNVKRRAYFIDDTVPTPDQDAGSNAALQHMIALMELGYKVTFLPADNMAQIDPYTRNLQKLGIECLYAPFYWSVEEVFRKTQHKPDLVYMHRFANASKYASMVRRHFKHARTVYNVADLHFLRLERQAELEASAELREEAATMRKLELAAMQQVDCVIVHSPVEAELLREVDPDLQVEVIPWTVHTNPVQLPFAERSGVVFVGGYRHVPNVDAAEYLAEEIMPLLRDRCPGIVATLVGSNMPPAVQALQRDDIQPIGYVPVLGEVLHRARCTVVPLRYGAGIKGKVLDSLAHGLPCILSEVAAEGLELPGELAWMIARSPEEFAEKLEAVHEDEALNERLSQLGLGAMASRYNSAAIRDALAVAIKPAH